MMVLCTARATAVGGRSVHADTVDGLLLVQLAVQQAKGGPGGRTNPEHVFACGNVACFGRTVEAVAKRAAGPVSSRIEVTAEIRMGPLDDGEDHGSTRSLKVRLAGVDRKRAGAFTTAAHRTCPSPTATRGSMPVALAALD